MAKLRAAECRQFIQAVTEKAAEMEAFAAEMEAFFASKDVQL